MKIFYVSVIEQHAGWGAEVFVNRGFIENGHETVTLDYRVHRHDLSRHFLALDDEVSVMFLQRGDWFPLELIRSVQRPRFFWASELVSRNDDQDRLLRSGLFQHIFVHSTVCKELIVRNGWIQEDDVSVLLNGFDEAVHHPMPGIEKDIEVLFIGSLTPRRRRWLDRLQDVCNVMVANAFGPAMTGYMNRAKIVLNIHAEDCLDTETRVFETLGCGAFLLSERLSSDNPFQSGEHLVEVSDMEEMAQSITYYLKQVEQRQAIAVQGHQCAMEKHSYMRRAECLAQVFQRYPMIASSPVVDKACIGRYAIREKVIRQLDWLQQLRVVTEIRQKMSGACHTIRSALKITGVSTRPGKRPEQ